MKNVIKYSTITALLFGFTHVALAENRVPSELEAAISPDYRNGDMQISNGEKFVWVKRIEGHDSDGNTHVLFNDDKGALVRLDKLAQAHTLINPSRVEKKGYYSELQLQLGDNSLTLDKAGMTQQPLPTNIAGNMTLHGQVEVKKFEVSSNGLSLKRPDAHKLARLTL